jgi:lipid-A-disaccharide synthase
LKYYIIAGETSGDMHAANLMYEIKKLDTNANFRCWGGDMMEKEGGVIVKHIKDLSFMGFVEVLMNIRTISKNLKFCKTDLLSYQPDALILVDFPGFNLRIAQFAKKNGLKVFYYISPSVWAWKESRVEIIKKSVDKLFAILPFEKDFYKKHNCDVDYEGHPLIDQIEKLKKQFSTREKFITDNNLNGKKIIACLPGSRKQEIIKLLPEMSKQQQFFPDFEFVIACAPNLSDEFYLSILKNNQIKLLRNKTYELMHHSHAGIIKSGTSTLEAALFNLPEVCCYKGNPISIWIARKVAKVKYISLPNLIMNKLLIKELIQENLNELQLKSELENIIYDINYRNKLQEDYTYLKELLGGPGASKRIAEKLVNFYLQKN